MTFETREEEIKCCTGPDVSFLTLRKAFSFRLAFAFVFVVPRFGVSAVPIFPRTMGQSASSSTGTRLIRARAHTHTHISAVVRRSAARVFIIAIIFFFFRRHSELRNGELNLARTVHSARQGTQCSRLMTCRRPILLFAFIAMRWENFLTHRHTNTRNSHLVPAHTDDMEVNMHVSATPLRI